MANMKQQAKICLNLGLFCSFFFFCACSGVANNSTTTDGSITAEGETYTLVVSGATTDSCTVTGESGQDLGDGSPETVTYQVGGEQTAIVECGDLAALFTVGAPSVELSEESTQVALALSGTAMQPGTEFLASALSGIAANENPEATTSIQDATENSIADWVSAYDQLTRSQELEGTLGLATTLSTSTQWLTQFIINFGDAVLLNSSGWTCSTSEVSAFSAQSGSDLGPTCENSSATGLNGYWGIYHQLVAFNDWNDPMYRPPLDVTAFDLYFREGGALDAFYDASRYNRTYTFAQIYDLIFSDLGYSFYSQDRDGNVTTETISATDLQTYLASISQNAYQAVRGGSANFNAYLQSQRFPESYNPAGGPFIDAVYDYEASVPAECLPTQGDASALDDCAMTLKRYDLNADNTITENASGDYFLQWEYNNGYTTTGFLREIDTSLYVRDANYQVLEFDIDPANASAAYVYNHRYDNDLDPLLCGDGTTLPFSNDDWTTLCDISSTFVDNAYILPKPEVLSRIFFLTSSITDWDHLTAYQAYAVIKLILHGVTAYPVDLTASPAVYALLDESDASASEIDAALDAFFDSGTAQTSAFGFSNLTIKEGEVGFGLDSRGRLQTSGTGQCWVYGSGALRQETCTYKTYSLTIDATSDVAVDYGRTYTVSGDIEVGSSSFSKSRVAVSSLWIYESEQDSDYSGLYARFTASNGTYVYVNFPTSVLSSIESTDNVTGRAGIYGFQPFEDPNDRDHGSGNDGR